MVAVCAFQHALRRRRPGQTQPRAADAESDLPEIDIVHSFSTAFQCATGRVGTRAFRGLSDFLLGALCDPCWAAAQVSLRAGSVRRSVARCALGPTSDPGAVSVPSDRAGAVPDGRARPPGRVPSPRLSFNGRGSARADPTAALARRFSCIRCPLLYWR